MNQETFRMFVSDAAKRAIAPTSRIGCLVLTQAAENEEPRLREPEMRHALAQEAEHRGDVYYGIEVPTKEAFRFTLEPGERETAARHDFGIVSDAVYNAPRVILLELKKDQPELSGSGDDPDCPKVRKDFQKLMLEEATSGKSMLHILHGADADTIPAVFEKYNAGIRWALRLSTPVALAKHLRSPFDDDRWFTFFVFVVRKRGRAGGNQPALYYREFPRFGDVLRRVAEGDHIFSDGPGWDDAFETAR